MPSVFSSNFQNVFLGESSLGNVLIFVLILIWTLVWKGIALWRAARNNHHTWFIILLVVNTLGILEILYIYIFSKEIIKTRSPSGPPTKL